MKENNDKLFLDMLNSDMIIKKIVDVYVETDKDRMKNGNYGSGNHWKIILTKEGNVEVGYFPRYSTRTDIHEGRAIQIATLDDNADIFYDDMDMNNLDDYWDFREHIHKIYLEDVMCEYEDETEDMDEKQKTDYAKSLVDELYMTWDNYYEFNSNGYEEEQIRAWHERCDWHSEDEILDAIEVKKERLEERIRREA